jgi:hypothetical protein
MLSETWRTRCVLQLYCMLMILCRAIRIIWQCLILAMLWQVYDEDMQGNIELDGDNEMFLSAMDEFLQESKDHALAEGVSSYIKNSHAIGWVPGADDNVPVPSLKDEEVLRRAQEFAIESTAEIAKDEEESAITEKELGEMMTSQEYLREEREQEQWDCETILSTYSTLDNHPTMIQVAHITPSHLYRLFCDDRHCYATVDMY